MNLGTEFSAFMTLCQNFWVLEALAHSVKVWKDFSDLIIIYMLSKTVMHLTYHVFLSVCDFAGFFFPKNMNIIRCYRRFCVYC